MSDLISRQAAYDEIIWNSDNGLIDAKVAIEALRKLPSVESERKTGKWIDKGVIGNTEANDFMCSECGWHEPDFPERIGELHYCTSCGAKMEVQDGKN
jgi:predicted RNA-binding Zn-ribbon protein involved in translation (DUF1610 family)